MRRAALIVALACATRAAHADDPDRPWMNVPTEVQTQANALFDAGNLLFAQQAHAAALDKYQAALALWDHPLIRFNMAVSLIRMDRVLDAAAQLERALAYGDKPFTPELYRQALDYRSLLAGRIGEVEVSCDQPDVHVTLDDARWFSCPGTQHRSVIAGPHEIVAQRDGFMTVTRKVVVTGRARTTERFSLVSVDSRMTLAYPYRRWVPWTVAGSGGAVALVGLAVWLVGRGTFDEFRAGVAKACGGGCEPGLTAHPDLVRLEDRAHLEQRIGVATMAIGGAVAVTGLVLQVLNRPRRVLPQVEVTPISGGLSGSARWEF